MHIEQGSDSFKVQFEANHRQKDIDFSWKGTIVGSADGTISYEMDGIAQREFRYAKIGICIHHPIQGTADWPFSGETAGVPDDPNSTPDNGTPNTAGDAPRPPPLAP